MSVFQNIDADRILLKGEHFFVIKDGFPVSPGHLLIISNELKEDYFSLSEAEKNDLPTMI